MIRKRRISVPVADALRHELEQESAKTGSSIAFLVEQLIEAGREKKAVAQQLAELKSTLETNPTARHHDQENHDTQVLQVLNQILTSIEQLSTSKSSSGEGIFISPQGFLHLFQESYFSSFLTASLVAESAPGAARQPVGFHLQNARQKAKAAVQQFINLETKK